MASQTIFTIGHSTHSTREFIKILKSFDVEMLVDVRHYPGSRHCPQFGKARLKRNLLRNNIEYLHMEELGGRRRVNKNSELNAAWKNPAFRGYADYMQTKEFKAALKTLMKLSKNKRVVIMCAEAVPWRCHRSMIGDALLLHRFSILDILDVNKQRPHTLTKFGVIKGKNIIYPPS